MIRAVFSGSGKGCYHVSTEPLAAGTVLLKEPALCLVMERPFLETRCPRCTLHISDHTIKCAGCNEVYYCSESCYNLDRSVHQFECRLLRRTSCPLRDDSDGIFMVRMLREFSNHIRLNEAEEEIDRSPTCLANRQTTSGEPVEFPPATSFLLQVLSLDHHEISYRQTDIALTWARTMHIFAHLMDDSGDKEGCVQSSVSPRARSDRCSSRPIDPLSELLEAVPRVQLLVARGGGDPALLGDICSLGITPFLLKVAMDREVCLPMGHISNIFSLQPTPAALRP